MGAHPGYVLEFIEISHPRNFADSDFIYTLEDIKFIKDNIICNGRCCNKRTSKYECKRCKATKRALCNYYHKYDDPADELAARIIYEYIFDFITIDDIASGKCMHPELRDIGHQERLKRLYKRARPSKYEWLKM
jgi:hypothetical protein